MKYWIFIILLSVSLFTKGQYSDSLGSALLNAEIHFWQADNDSTRYATLLQKVHIYNQAGLFHQAINQVERTREYALTGDEKSQLKYEELLNSFLNNDYGYCTTFHFDSNEVTSYSKEIALMQLYSLNELQEWTNCKRQMLTYINRMDTTKAKEILALPETYNYKDPAKSKRLSSYLPGLGEIYAGYPVKGVTSFVLTTGFLAFAGYNFYFHYYVTGFFSGLFPMTKFYSGGKRLIVNLANSHNEQEVNKIKRRYSNEILGILK